MATRSTNTMTEGLQRILQDLGALKIAPDADLGFLIGLETIILTELRKPFEQAAGQMADAASGGPGGGIPVGGAGGGGMPAMVGAGAGPGMGMGGPPLGGPGVGGGMPAPGPRFSPDQLRMALRGGGVQGG